MYSNGGIYIPDRKPPMGAVRNPYLKINRGLVGDWMMWEGAGPTVEDLSGNGNHGAITGALWVPGKSGSALDFTDDIVNCGYNSSINALTEFTIITRVLTTELPGAGKFYYAVCQRDNAANRFNLSINGDSSDKFAFGISTDGVPGTVYSTAAPSLNAWYNIAVTYDDNGDRKPRLFINGIEDSDIQSASVGTINSTPTTPICIGNRAVSLDRDWHGPIEFVYIYNRSFSPSEISQLSQEPFCGFRWASIEQLAVYYEAVAGGIAILRRRRSA